MRFAKALYLKRVPRFSSPSLTWVFSLRISAEKTAGYKYSLYEGQDIGQDSGSPVDFTYTPPFKFTGKLNKVTIDVK